MASLSGHAIDDLKRAIKGQVLQPADGGYDDARRVWNAMIDHRPAVIVRCAGAADVRRAVVAAISAPSRYSNSGCIRSGRRSSAAWWSFPTRKRGALMKYREAAAHMPDDLPVWVVMRFAPPLPFLPPAVHGQPIIAFAICHTGAIENGPAVANAVRAFGTPCGEHVGSTPYTAWQKAFDPLLAPGARNYWKSHNLIELPDELLSKLDDAIAVLPSPQCEISIGQLGGQASRVTLDATAYPCRDARYVLNVHSRWSNVQDDARCVAWARAFFDATAPFAQGSVYVNFITQDESARVSAAYGSNYARLATAKARYDPHSLFRCNQNILPAAV